MCGIAGAVNFKLAYRQIDQNMFHRGPDEQAGFISDNVDLYHLRLSILDISGGKQPMHLDDRYTIIFNGEIYNYLEVKKELTDKGISFRTQSDTEVIIQSYKMWGTNCVQKFVGMWAFALWDEESRKLISFKAMHPVNKD